MTDVEYRPFGFKYGGIVYLSDSWSLLKDKVLELGAHRIGGQPGTGVDVRKVIEAVDQEALNAMALDYPITYVDEAGEDIDEPVPGEGETVPENTSYRPEVGDLVNVTRGPHAGHVGSVGSTQFEWEWAITNAQGECLIATAKELELVIRGGGVDLLSVKDLHSETHRLIADLAGDFPATAEEAFSVRNQLSDAGDVDGLRAFHELLLNEHNEPSNRDHIAAVDRFILDTPQEEEWIGAEGEDPSITAQPALTDSATRLCQQAGVDASRELIRPEVREELANNVLTNPVPIEPSGYAQGDEVRITKLWPGTLGVVFDIGTDSVEGREQVYVRDVERERTGIFYADELEHYRHPSFDRFDPDYEVKAPLPEFRFVTRLDANRRALLGDAIVEAVLAGRRILVTRALNEEVVGVYVTDEGWAAVEDEA